MSHSWQVTAKRVMRWVFRGWMIICIVLGVLMAGTFGSLIVGSLLMDLTPEQVSGAYIQDNPESDMRGGLIIRPDGTFVQVVILPDKPPMIARGRWEFDEWEGKKQSIHFLRTFLLPEGPKWKETSLHVGVERFLGSLQISIDEDHIHYVKGRSPRSLVRGMQ